MCNLKDFDESEIEDLGIESIPPEVDEKVKRMIAEAEEDLIEEARVNIRWQKAQLVLIKKAAAMIGIPYQIYIRDIVFRKSVEDIEKFSKILKSI
jgi:predicted DNA binding CopG/RHH family protein